ncbi:MULTISPECIES: hypothetical protein [Sporosarcina]|uniref:hypothetical protein n=1 Tax=Sporosarcina TaxID=1569 RepID=UPI00129BCC8B|nr:MULTISPECIES: hypothetical protein [Sporosarcina]GKV64575.1 hypothetical protein NCCP2331_07280 [Sporosarcina sp. NCCP-2331]GLB54552.1 hypothetical protein NCCP2378_03370 [Sporosarcina sp. NCCP-2378]
MFLFLIGLIHLVWLALLIQLLTSAEMEKSFMPLIKLAVGLWILQFLLQLVGHKW